MAFDFSKISSEILNSESNQSPIQSFEVVNIPFEDVLPSDHNRYELSDIDLLKYSIDSKELDQNFVVRPGDNNTYEENGKYVLLSGHRRRLAIELIRKEHPEKYRYLPCKIRYDVKDQDDEIIALQDGNATSRKTISDGVKLLLYRDLKAVVEHKKANGTLAGNKRQYLASLLHFSEPQVQRFANVEANLIPELKNKIESGNLSIQAANDFAGLPEEKQLLVNEQIEQKLKGKEVKPAQPEEDKCDEPDNHKTPGETPESQPENDQQDPEPEFVRVTKEDISVFNRLYTHVKKAMLAEDYLVVNPKDRKAIKKDFEMLQKIEKDIMKRIK